MAMAEKAMAALETPAPANVPEFTVKMAQDMLEELIKGYSGAEFQATLKKQIGEAEGDKKKIATIKKDLFMTVQSTVLPKYGFEATPRGVQASLGAFAPYNFTDPLVMERNAIVSYWTSPEVQDVSLEAYLEKLKAESAKSQEAQAKAAAKPQAKAAAEPTAKPAAKPQAKPQAKGAGKGGSGIGSAKQAMMQKMKAQGNKGATISRMDAQGQVAGLALLEFVEEVNEMYEQGRELAAAGRFEEAEPYLRDSYQLFEEICGEGHIYTIACANTLGFTLHEQGRYAEGEPICKVAVNGFQRLSGLQDPQTVASMNNYALCLQGLGKMSEAAAILKQILEVSIANCTPEATVPIMSNLAETLRLDGEVQEAEKMFFKAFRIMSKVHGPESLQCIHLLNNLAVCFRDMRKNDVARQHYERALKGLRQYYGPEHPKVKLVQKNLEELKTDRETEQVQLPPHLRIEPRKKNLFWQANQEFTYTPMSKFSKEGTKAFQQVIQPVSAMMTRKTEIWE
jgi:tetratricopeptide (TPR) repeat protein